MAGKFAQFDHTQPNPQQVIGWYDTDAFTYAQMPDTADLVQVTEQQWADHFDHPRLWRINNGDLEPYTEPPPVLPPPIILQAIQMIQSPVAVESTSTPGLNADYAIDSNTQQQITGIASAIAADLGLPGGGTTFNWPDATGTPHQWDAVQFIALAKAVMNYVYALSQVIQGHQNTLPTVPLTVP